MNFGKISLWALLIVIFCPVAGFSDEKDGGLHIELVEGQQFFKSEEILAELEVEKLEPTPSVAPEKTPEQIAAEEVIQKGIDHVVLAYIEMNPDIIVAEGGLTPDEFVKAFRSDPYAPKLTPGTTDKQLKLEYAYLLRTYIAKTSFEKQAASFTKNVSRSLSEKQSELLSLARKQFMALFTGQE